MNPIIHIKSVYAPPSASDGYRVLVDRLWPRGMTKEKVAASYWAKDLAPTSELRKWYGHDPALWTDFKSRYLHELKKNAAVDVFVKDFQKNKLITLLYAARDHQHTHALVLQHYLQKCFDRQHSD